MKPLIQWGLILLLLTGTSCSVYQNIQRQCIENGCYNDDGMDEDNAPLLACENLMESPNVLAEVHQFCSKQLDKIKAEKFDSSVEDFLNESR